jgi:hypothetical protein
MAYAVFACMEGAPDSCGEPWGHSVTAPDGGMRVETQQREQ